ncbi:unnamed protein product (macronuclear) [Paramecium tetraurelia]|uniref:Protein of centriole 5 n=1 Tax=Paramecium tetraurelia TaxID=5888 RepID=A0DPF1_PARTE|nr:uncharacterized protein GSPATT00019100001 [Paramecium tetraurelia]CAK84918.1 unnamed protein product [Paramecium tetraurelia]|eukprot:XP_001452315.1 hypothetical protein (macronuclear) [Paramecium tetraurelia strain d4-2]
MSTVQMKQHINLLRKAVGEIKDSTQERITQISTEVQFNPQDNKEFNDLLNEIKQETLRKLHAFYELKVNNKTNVYQQELSNCSTNYTELQQQVLEHQEIVKEKINQNLQKREQYDKLAIRMVLNYERLKLYKKYYKSLKQYATRKRKSRQAKFDAYQKYQLGLQTKVFYYWRSTCHKTGYQTMLITQAAKEIKNIQQCKVIQITLEFIDIVKILKAKIAETEEQIQIKKNAKAEFSYNLSRNLLKTISNLSMEVMSLRQVTIKGKKVQQILDNQINNDENTKFLKEVNGLIQSKLSSIQQFKEKLKSSEEPAASETHKKNKQSIQFDLQNQSRK